MSDASEGQSNSGKNPAGIRGFSDNVRSMFVATYTALLLYFLFLLLKHILNALKKRQGGEGYPSVKGGGGRGGGYEGFRKSRKKGLGMGTAAPPPPPPPAPGVIPSAGQMQGAGGMMSGGVGGPGGGGLGGGLGGAGGDYDDYYNDMTQGVETEKGYPGEPRISQALSRAADVSRLGFLILLGGTVLNALSYDASGAANALAWILFALIVLWAILALITPSRWIPLVMSLLVIGIAIPFYAVGFSISDGPLQIT